MGRRVVVTTGYVHEGKLRLVDQAGLVAAVKQTHNCKVVIRIEESLDPRSVALNAYYWGVAIHHVSEETGFTPDEAHEQMKELHLPKRFAALRANGTIRGMRVFDGSTTDLSNQEEWEYISAIQRWAAETLDVVIPDPSEVVAA